MVNISKSIGGDLHEFHKHFAVQLNDTHPAIAVAELMRLLVDEHDVSALAGRMLHLANHPEMWPQMGRAGRGSP